MPAFHRIHLRSADGDHVTLYLPLAEDGRLDPSGPQPWLFKAMWDGFDVLGELEIGAGDLHRLVWADEDEFLTDLGTTPIKKHAQVRIYEGDDIATADVFEFTVADLRRV